MKTTHALRSGAAIIAALACFMAVSSPASATTYTYTVVMESGRVSLGGLNLDLPGSWATPCTPPAVGSVAITGTIDDATGIITAALAITPFFTLPPPFTGNYALIATATGSGTYNATTGNFSGLAFTTVAFAFRNLVGSGTTCAPGTTTVCSGTATLTASGGLYNGATLPLGTSAKIYANATGTVVTRGTCNFPFSVYVTVSASLSLSDNPNDDVLPSGTDPGAILHQT